MTRIALAGFIHETNTFTPIPCTYDDFALAKSPYPGYARGEEIFYFRGRHVNIGACGFLNAAEEKGYTIVPILWAIAEVSNQVTSNAFEKIMSVIAAGISDQGPFDGIFLDLHGAMVFENYQDAEAEILRRVRAIVGPIPIVVSLDPHGNLSSRSFELASALIGYRTSPHVDTYENGVRCAQMMEYLLQKKPIYKTFRKLPFLMPLSTSSTFTEPNKSIFARLDEVEQDPDVISTTILVGFPGADVESTGPSLFTYATSQEKSEKVAEELYQAILEREAEYSVNLSDADGAVTRAIELSETVDKPVILVDVNDNPGAGAPSDTVRILETLVHHNAKRAAFAILNDAESAASAHAAGENAEVTLYLGGKLVPGQKPFKGTFKVVKLFEGEFIVTGPMSKGLPYNLGKMAHLQIGDIHIVVSSKRTQANDQTFFRVVGIEPRDMKILVLKSSNHFRADFESISNQIIYVDAPGADTEDPRLVNYQHLREGVRLGGNGPTYVRPT